MEFQYTAWNLVQHIRTRRITHTYVQADAYLSVTRCLRTCRITRY
ncbi:hypothetical protein [Phocaeicola sartorii]|nr:hypothetical protein [Phocaeicola sartorii]